MKIYISGKNAPVGAKKSPSQNAPVGAEGQVTMTMEKREQNMAQGVARIAATKDRTVGLAKVAAAYYYDEDAPLSELGKVGRQKTQDRLAYWLAQFGMNTLPKEVFRLIPCVTQFVGVTTTTLAKKLSTLFVFDKDRGFLLKAEFSSAFDALKEIDFTRIRDDDALSIIKRHCTVQPEESKDCEELAAKLRAQFNLQERVMLAEEIAPPTIAPVAPVIPEATALVEAPIVPATAAPVPENVEAAAPAPKKSGKPAKLARS